MVRQGCDLVKGYFLILKLLLELVSANQFAESAVTSFAQAPESGSLQTERPVPGSLIVPAVLLVFGGARSAHRVCNRIAADDLARDWSRTAVRSDSRTYLRSLALQVT